MAKLPEPKPDGLWNLYKIEGEKLDEVMSTARDEFISYMKQYKWNGGNG